MKPHNLFASFQPFEAGDGRQASFYSLPALEKAGLGNVSRLPVSIRVVLESVLRNCDNQKVSEANVRELAQWQPKAQRTAEIPFVVARIVLQDFTGVPLLVDLAAMRSVAGRLGKNPKLIEPLVPVDLVVDHSVQVDFAGSSQALQLNLDIEFKRNRERYEFLKWGQQAFKTFKVVPPGIGIVHQVNLEFLAQGVLEMPVDGQRVVYPDTLVGTDSHTTMINGLGIVGWGVGGIEAEAGMLGQPVYFLTPDVVGVHLTGQLKPGVTATDMVLHVTQMLRAQKVVGKFVEFFGEGAAALSVPDRATIGNMAPEYGATMGFFPVDDQTVNYLRLTGRNETLCRTFENYYRAQKMFGMPRRGEIDYSVELELDLGTIQPGVAGPKRPQDRINLPDLRQTFTELLAKPIEAGGYGKNPNQKSAPIRIRLDGSHSAVGLPAPSTDHRTNAPKPGEPRNQLEMLTNRPAADDLASLPPGPHPTGEGDLADGSVVIAAITSCTNTSNPSVMLAAGLLARKAVERGLKVNPLVKTSLAPGSRVVSDYLAKAGLQPFLDQLGFQIVGYGCTTCIGNSGPLPGEIDEAIQGHDVVAASVLSGNRNFEARVHQNVKANFLMSPPLVIAFALAGRVDIDLSREPLGSDKNGQPVFLRDLWPAAEEISQAMQLALKPEVYRRLYADFASQNPKWDEIPSSTGDIYRWDEQSDYIQEPPFFENFTMVPGEVAEIRGARPLGIFGDSVTTDHISPAGSIKLSSPAGKYLSSRGVTKEDFNSYGSRRGNDRVMTRGTFANVRIKNLMVPGIEGGVTRHYPSGEQLSIYDASMRYQQERMPLIILAGHEYGTGSSRDWAAKGTRLLGVKAVVAASFERIHRSNLLGMGVLPLQFQEGISAQTLRLDGTETYDLAGLGRQIKPQQDCTLRIHRQNGKPEEVSVRCRIDTPIEVEYYQHGGILPYVLRQLLR